MLEFEDFKRKRLKQDPMAKKYTDYQWSRAFEAYQNTRGVAPGGDDPGSGASGDKGGGSGGSDGVGRSRSGRSGGRRGPSGNGARGRGVEFADYQGVRQTVQTLLICGLVAAFFFAVIYGWSTAYLGGSAALVGFLGACALFALAACLLLMVQRGVLAAVDAAEAAQAAAQRAGEPRA